jgi:hypothetical protein
VWTALANEGSAPHLLTVTVVDGWTNGSRVKRRSMTTSKHETKTRPKARAARTNEAKVEGMAGRTEKKLCIPPQTGPFFRPSRRNMPVFFHDRPTVVSGYSHFQQRFKHRRTGDDDQRSGTGKSI